jgi:hypothetical protein
MQIGELLVRAGAVSPSDLDDAVGWQVLYGGRLGTNLLELGLVEERALAECLGRQHGCEWHAGEVELASSLVQTIPPVLARRHELVPWRVEGRKFKVLAIAPQECVSLLDEIGFRLGKIVKPVVAPEFRVHQALRRHYGSQRQMRAIDFGVQPRRPSQQASERQQEEAELGKAADLMDDEAFAAIYREVMDQRGGPPPPAEPAPAAPRATPPPTVVAAPPVLHPVAAPAVIDAASLLTPLAEEEEELPLLDAELIEETGPVETDDGGLAQENWASAFADLEQQLAASEPPPTPPADLTPLSFKDAVAAIGKVDGRDAVARAVLRYARSKAARAILLQVQGDVALGWDALGEDLSPEVARAIAFPLTAPGAFNLVRQTRSHYIGPLGKESGNVRFLKLAGKKWPASAVLLPVLFRGKPVYILYVDNGHKQQVDPDVGELLILSQNITRSMEQLVASRQRR